MYQNPFNTSMVVFTLIIRTDMPEQAVTVLIRRHSTWCLIRVYTVSHTASSCYTHEQIIKWTCSNLRTSIVRCLGVQILKVNTSNLYVNIPRKFVYQEAQPSWGTSRGEIIRNKCGHHKRYIITTDTQTKKICNIKTASKRSAGK